jgi:glycosyltransferase involved in cell wall biosynthesis
LKQNKFTIAVVANTGWNIVNFRLGLINALIAKGYKVIAIAPADEYSSKIISTGCHYIPLKRLERKGTNPFKDFRLLLELYNIYRKESVDIALQFTIKPNIYGSLAASFAKVKTICTVTGLGYSFLNNNLVSKLARRLYKFAFKKANLVAFQNNDDRNLFTSEKLVKNQKTVIIRGSGINCEKFKPLPKSDLSTSFVFLFVGRLLYDKGVIEYLKAAEIVKDQFPEITFQILGSLDNDNPSCISLEILEDYQRKGIVTYLGTSDDVKDKIRNSDTVVLPSYREGLPRVMLEAISMAKPVITTDTAGCRDTVVDNVTGFLVPVKNIDKLADAMIKMINLPDSERVRMGKNGRELALEQFDEKAVIENYFQNIEFLLNSK